MTIPIEKRRLYQAQRTWETKVQGRQLSVGEQITIALCDALRDMTATALELEHREVEHLVEMVLDRPQIIKCENCDADWQAEAHRRLMEVGDG